MMHRSACMVAPENTVPALEEAVRQGADGVEIDIRKTRDGVFVLYHDDWVLQQRGTAGKIEEMMLAETQRLDVGDRWGPKWKGLHPPLFADVLDFAKANSLRLYLDIKTVGVYDEVMKLVEKHGCMGLIHATGGQVPEKHYFLPISWITGWNYTEGGEEDPERMRQVIAGAQPGVYGIMCDDARAIVRALGRNPERRSLVPFKSTMREKLASRVEIIDITADKPVFMLKSAPADAQLIRSACQNLSRKPDRAALESLIELAQSHSNYAVRQDACWALGSLKDDRAFPTLLKIAQTPYEQKTAGATEYRDFFLKTAAGCALARIDSSSARGALKALLASTAEGDRDAAAIGIAVFGTTADLKTLAALAGPGKQNDGIVASFVVGYAGRFGDKAIPIYLEALSRSDVAKQAVFGLASIGPKGLTELKKMIANPKTLADARHRAELAIYWIKESRTQRREPSSYEGTSK
jgi:HEAT repeat protein